MKYHGRCGKENLNYECLQFADFIKPSISAEDAAIASIINQTAKTNRKPQDDNQFEHSPREEKRHNLRNPLDSSLKEPVKAEAPKTGEKRGRGRPRKVRSDEQQSPQKQVPQKAKSGALTLPSRRIGQDPNRAPKSAETDQDPFDVPNDAPNSTAKATKPIGSRKQPSRNATSTRSASAADAIADAAANSESNRKNLKDHVQQSKANTIEQQAEALKEARETSANLSTGSPDHDPMEVPDSQNLAEHAVQEEDVGQGLISANDEPVHSIEQLEEHREDINTTPLQDDDADGDPEYEPTGVVEESFLDASHADVAFGEEEEGNVTENGISEKDGGDRTGRPRKRRKRGQSPTADRTTVSADPSESDVGAVVLFGQSRGWETVLNGARTVGVSYLKGKEVREKPGLATNVVKRLVDTIKDAVNLYKQVGSRYQSGMSDEGIQMAEERLASMNQEIFEEVQDLSEENSGNKKGEVIQDIYAHAIPNLIYWLKAAMKCRSEQYGQEDDILVLQEVIRLQDLILHLCQKARQWKTKPLTDRPITKSTSQEIGPYLRDIRKAFQQELERRERVFRQNANEDAIALSHERRRERLERQKQVNSRKKADQRTKIMRNLQQNPSPYRKRPASSQPLLGVSTYPFHQHTQPVMADQWTTEQNLELVSQLMRADIGHLPGRCSRCIEIACTDLYHSPGTLLGNAQCALATEQASRAYSGQGALLQRYYARKIRPAGLHIEHRIVEACHGSFTALRTVMAPWSYVCLMFIC